MISRLKSFVNTFLFNKKKENEYYIVGYPKSGNTWLQLMLGKYAHSYLGFEKHKPIPLMDTKILVINSPVLYLLMVH